MYKAESINTSHPTVQAITPMQGVSERYGHVTTSQVVDALTQRGWACTGGTARSTRKPERFGHTAHVLRFSHPHLSQLSEGRAEVVLLNSSDRSTAFEVSVGFFRFACANGLIVRSGTVGAVRMSHYGLRLPDALSAVEQMVDRVPQALERINVMRGITLSRDQQLTLAARCARARWGDRLAFLDDHNQWVAPQRMEDFGADLWTTFNRIQERIIRGGAVVALHAPEGEHWMGFRVNRRRATAIRGAIKQHRLNSDLWRIAEEFALAE